ncbi:MAG: hypothetical protein EPN75_09025 [Beijerinckiaceae bacterium]|nr:MAG: hypothetical protein EPN75_09025 [Beijerinckiaceae bacterium]
MRLVCMFLYLLCSGTLIAMPAFADPVDSANPKPVAASQLAAKADAVRPMPEAAVGDHWTYEVRDQITDELKRTITATITDTTDKKISIRRNIEGKHGAFAFRTYDRAWNLYVNGDLRYEPRDGTGVKLPLVVGNKWSFRADVVNSNNGRAWRRIGTSRVVSEEKVTTAAGTFDAFKIETSFVAHNTRNHRTQYKSDWVTWYAPAIDHWVKRTIVFRANGRVRQKISFILTAYGRRKSRSY